LTTIKTNDDDDDDDQEGQRRLHRRHQRRHQQQQQHPHFTIPVSPHPDSLRYPSRVRISPSLHCPLVDTKKPSPFPLHRLARLRVTRRLHHPPSGTSDRARAVGPPRAAPIARLPPVSLISQVLVLVAPRALRNLFGVVLHLLDRPAYLRVTST